MNYPIVTIIMRNYSYEQSEAILQAMKGMEDYFAVEVTLNTPKALCYIKKLNGKYGDKIRIGAGTVRNTTDVKNAIEAGAKFLLGPHIFSKDMINIAKKENVLTIPSAMTPTEINMMVDNSVDIIKIFPASIVTPKFFKDVQAPLGKLPLMAVGGVSIENALEFLDCGAQYLGIGSNLFNRKDLEELNVRGLSESLRALLSKIQGR